MTFNHGVRSSTLRWVTKKTDPNFFIADKAFGSVYYLNNRLGGIMCNPYITSSTIKYPCFVKQSGITCQGSNGYRFLLTIPFNGFFQKNEMVVIMKNPSSASITTCDRTISKVCHTAYNNGYSGVIILNLFPYRATIATDVQFFYCKDNYHRIMEINLKIIKKVCTARDVVFAWGKDSVKGRRIFPDYYDKAVQAVTSTITSNTYYAMRCTCKYKHCSSQNHPSIRYPLHGLAWSNNSTLYSY